MPNLLQGFPWRFAIYFISALYLVADLYVWKGPLHERLMEGRGSSPDGQGGGYVAEVYGRPVTRLELEEGIRDYLWKRGESWESLGAEARKQTRWLVLETLVNDRILNAFRKMNGLDHVPQEENATSEVEMLRRQFAIDAEYPKRLAVQQQTQQSLDAAVRDSQLDEAWIAEKIAARLREIGEKEVRAWYEEFKESLRIPAAYHAAHIFLTRHDKTKPDREAEIREIQRQLRAGEKTFAALAAEYSEDDRTKSVGGDLSWISRGRMPADFMAAVEKLKVGEFSGPVLTELGWHLIIVMKKRESRLPMFDECREEISAMLTSRRREEAVKSLIAELRERSQVPTKFVFYHRQIIDRAEPAP